MKKVLVVFLLACILLTGSSVVFGSEREVIPSHELVKAFADNRSAAEAQYLGKVVLVNGVVLSTGMSRYMTPNVVLSDRAKGDVQVICVLPRLDVGKLANFTPGQSVTMSGKVYRVSERGVITKECKVAE